MLHEVLGFKEIAGNSNEIDFDVPDNDIEDHLSVINRNDHSESGYEEDSDGESSNSEAAAFLEFKKARAQEKAKSQQSEKRKVAADAKKVFSRGLLALLLTRYSDSKDRRTPRC